MNEIELIEDARSQFSLAQQREATELQFELETEEELIVFVKGTICLVSYLDPNVDGSSLIVYNPDYSGNKGETVAFREGDGQVNFYPAANTIPTEEALCIVEYFLKYKTLPPWAVWHQEPAF